MMWLKRGLVIAGAATALSTGAWCQELIPQGTFEGLPVGALQTFPPAAPATDLSQTDFGGGNPDVWSVTATGPINGAQSGALISSGSGFNFSDILRSNNFSQTLNNRYLVNVRGLATAATSVTIQLTNGTWLEGPGAGTSDAVFVLGAAVTQFAFQYQATSTTASARVDFLVTGTGFGAVAGQEIRLDNISVQRNVPELNGAVASVPIVLLLGGLLLAYDRRRMQPVITSLT